MRPKSYSANKALGGGKELSWMDQMCLKIETYCELGEPGRGPTLLMQDGFVCVASSTHVQEMEMQFNSLGSGLRKLANEANDFVQELLMPPTFLNDNVEATEKGVDLKKQCNVGIVHGQKKNVEQPTAAPLNFVDGACIEISAHAEAKEDSCHSGMLNLASMEEQSSLHSEGSFEVTWDWPQEPFELSQEAETEQQLLQDVGEASCSSVQLPEAALEASRSVKDESSTDAKDIQDPNEMVEGEDQLAIRLSKKEEPKKLSQPSMSSSSLDGWESSDVLICEEIIEPDSWHDWELL